MDHEQETYVVVLNDEEQYSIWRAGLEIPHGWRDGGYRGTQTQCLDYIDDHWTDMRPLSLRLRMDGGSGQARNDQG